MLKPNTQMAEGLLHLHLPNRWLCTLLCLTDLLHLSCEASRFLAGWLPRAPWLHTCAGHTDALNKLPPASANCLHSIVAAHLQLPSTAILQLYLTATQHTMIMCMFCVNRHGLQKHLHPHRNSMQLLERVRGCKAHVFCHRHGACAFMPMWDGIHHVQMLC